MESLFSKVGCFSERFLGEKMNSNINAYNSLKGHSNNLINFIILNFIILINYS